jgi:hypothetical protein
LGSAISIQSESRELSTSQLHFLHSSSAWIVIAPHRWVCFQVLCFAEIDLHFIEGYSSRRVLCRGLQCPWKCPFESGSSLEEIGPSAFASGGRLKSMVAPVSLQRICSGCFESCSAWIPIHYSNWHQHPSNDSKTWNETIFAQIH